MKTGGPPCQNFFDYQNRIGIGIGERDPEASLHITSNTIRSSEQMGPAFPHLRLESKICESLEYNPFIDIHSSQIVSAPPVTIDINADCSSQSLNIVKWGNSGPFSLLEMNEREANFHSSFYDFSGLLKLNAGNFYVNTNNCTINNDRFTFRTNYFNIGDAIVYYHTPTSTAVSISAAIRVRDASGTTNFSVAQDGNIHAREINVHTNSIPDYVFNADYKLMPLAEVEKYVKKNKHLPNIPSEKEYKERNGVNVGELNMKLLEKVEELTLYMISLKKEVDILKNKGGQ
jgi:hypothetical protein